MCGHFSKHVFQERERILIQPQADHRHRARAEPAAIRHQFFWHDVEDQVLEILELARAATWVAGLPRLELCFNRRITIAKWARRIKRRPACFLPVARLSAVRPRGLPLRHTLTRSISMPGKASAMRCKTTATYLDSISQP